MPSATLTPFEPTVAIKTLWSESVTSGIQKQRLELRPAFADERAFVAGYDGDIAAYDAHTGASIWKTEVEIPITGGPGVGFGVVVVGGSDGEVIALDSTDGALAWRVTVSSEILSSPAVGESVVIVRTNDGKLFGLDKMTGERIWVYDRTVPTLTLRGTSSPMIADDMLVAGFDGGRLVAVSLAQGRLLWESPIVEPTGRTEIERLVDIDGDPIIADGVVYVVTFQGRIAALELRSGKVLWQRDMSSHAGLGLGRSLLYVTDNESHVWALDRDSGVSLWRQRGLERRGVTRPIEFGEYAVVADAEGYVHWLSIDDGRFVARVQIGSTRVIAPPTATATAVYILDTGGELTALTLP